MQKTNTQTATATALIAAALLLFGPAAQHPGAGPVTEILMWLTLLAGTLTLPAQTVQSRRQS